ncbi:hypothetical protein JL720_7306 [Aureococcus anophagefferens]|nr:hypothetical protein JL720_7306 [Aureococcus anophagefferens]
MATRPSAQALANAARAVSDDKPRRNRRTKPEAANAPPPPPTEKRAAPRPKPKRRPNRARRDDGASAAAEAVVARDPRAVVAAEAPRSAEVSPGILDAWVATQLRRGVKPSIPDAMGYLRSVGVNLRQLDDDRRQAWLDAIEATVDRAAAADDVPEAAEAPAEAPAVIVVEAPAERHRDDAASEATAAEAPDEPTEDAPAGGDALPDEDAAVAAVGASLARARAAIGEDEALARAADAAALSLLRWLGEGLDEASRAYVAKIVVDEALSEDDAGDALASAEEAARPSCSRTRTADLGAPRRRPRRSPRSPTATRRPRPRSCGPRLVAECFPQVREATVAAYLAEHRDVNAAAEALYAEAERVLRDMEQQESLDRRVARQGAFFTHRLSKDERARLLDEFASRPPIPAGGHTTGCHVAPGKREARKQTRYRDGKVATLTGEKFLVQPKETADFVKQTSVSLRIYAGGRTH